MQCIVDNLAVSYSKSGRSGQVILLVHGWGDSSLSFDSLIKQLQDHYTVIALDLPGFGASQIPNMTWTLDDYAKFLGAFVSKLNIEPQAIIGHSNGGAIAIRAIAHDYARTKELVLLASSGIRETNKLRKQTLKTLAKPAKLAIKLLPKRKQRQVKQKLYTAVGSDFMVAEHMRETFKNIVATDVLEDARQITLPTLLIYGDKDEATPLAHGKLLSAAIKDSQLMVMEGTSHFVHQEQVYQVARLIKEFIK